MQNALCAACRSAALQNIIKLAASREEANGEIVWRLLFLCLAVSQSQSAYTCTACAQIVVLNAAAAYAL